MSKIFYTDDELASIQVEKEIAMKIAGEDRFNANNNRFIQAGEASSTAWNKRILQELISPMALAIDEYKAYYEGRRGKPAKSLAYLRSISSREAAYITLKVVFDSLTRETTMQFLACTVGIRIEDQVRFSRLAGEAPKYIEKVQKALRQNKSHNYKHGAAVLAGAERSLIQGNEAREMEPKPALRWNSWAKSDQMHLGCLLVDIFANNVLFNGETVIVKRKVFKNGQEKCLLSISDATLEWVEQYKGIMSVMGPSYAPCVIPPRDWVSPTEGGYHVQEIADTLPMVKCRKGHRDRLTIEQMPKVYQAINYLQKTRWTINERVFDIVQQCIELGTGLGLPEREPYEVPQAPVRPELSAIRGKELKEHMTEDEWDTFIQWKSTATTIRTLENERKQDFAKVLRVMETAHNYLPFENIYFVYTADHRGRVYARSDSVSPQGCDLQKGLISLARGKELGKEGYFWWAVKGAGLWGNDKCSFTERVTFIEAMSDKIRDMAADPIGFTEWAAADKPWQFLSWAFEWADYQDWIESGKDGKQFETHCVCPQDGSCSGTQHYCAMTRDERAGVSVNLVPSDEPKDLYADVASLATLWLKGLTRETRDTRTATTASALLGMQGGINRDVCKKPVMIQPYGGTRISCLDSVSLYMVELQVKENSKAKAQGRKPEAVHSFVDGKVETGLNIKDGQILASNTIWKSLSGITERPLTAMTYIQGMARECVKAGSHLEWPTPSGFIVEHRVMEEKPRRVKTQLLGQTYMTLRQETLTYDKYKMKSAAPPHFIHSMDASHLVLAVCEAEDKGIEDVAVIHDSFGAAPADTPEFRYILVDTFGRMYEEHDVLTALKEYNEARLLVELPLDVPEQGELDLSLLRKSAYCFG